MFGQLLIAGSLVIILSLFFRYTVIGRALRAVADDHQAALSVGIPLSTIWIYVWTTAGLGCTSSRCCMGF